MNDGVITVVYVLVTTLNAGLVLYWRGELRQNRAALEEFAALQREALRRRGEG